MPRLTRLVAVALAAATVGACGSTANHVAAKPAPLKLSLAASGDEAKAALYPQRPTTYVLDGTLADLGTHANVRRLVGHAVSSSDVARIAGALGLHASVVATDTGFQVVEGDARLTVDTSGGATFVDYSRTGGVVVGGGSAGSGEAFASTGVAVPPDAAPTPSPPDVGTKPPVEPPVPPPTVPPFVAPVDVPSSDEAVQIAQSLLDDLGVLSGQQWAHDVTDANEVAFSCAAGAACGDPSLPPVTARNVTYELLVDGARVPGIGWSVTIGEHRRVESVSGTWAQADSGDPYPLRPTASVFDDLENGRGQYVGPQPMMAMGAADIAPVAPGSPPPLEVHITGVSLGAARWDGTEGSKPVVYIVPTYRFKAHVGSSDPYDIELLALDPGSFAIAAPVAPGVPKEGPPASGIDTPGVEPQPAPAPKPLP